MRKWTAVFLALLLLLGASAYAQDAFPPASEPLYRGIDVSVWQREIDFERVKASGVAVVYIRSSLGANYVDPYFEENYAKAKAAGLKVGLYHFCTATSESEAAAQARFFAGLLKSHPSDALAAGDFGATLPSETLTAVALAFLETTQSEGGAGAMLYTDASGARDQYGEALTRFPIWVANYGVSSPEPNGKWSSWTGFQYSDVGRVPGVDGNVDLDWFAKEVFLDEPPEPEPEPEPAQGVYYYIAQAGDSFASVANRFDIAPSALREGNVAAKNGELAPGQILALWLPERSAGGVGSYYAAQPNATYAAIAALFRLRAQAVEAVNPNELETGLAVAIPEFVARATLSAPDTLLESGYVAQRGDTLASVADVFGLSESRLAAFNGLRTGDALTPGTILSLRARGIPSTQTRFTGGYVVQRADTLSGIARSFGTSVSALFAANQIRDANLIFTGQILRIP